MPPSGKAALIVTHGRKLVDQALCDDASRNKSPLLLCQISPGHSTSRHLVYIRYPCRLIELHQPNASTVILPPATHSDHNLFETHVTIMDCTAQWIDDASAITANARLAGCSTISHPYDVESDLPSVSPRHPRLSQTSIRDLTPDGSESSDPFNESDTGPTDEERDSEALSLETGPDELDDPWPYTFRVSQSHSSVARMF